MFPKGPYSGLGRPDASIGWFLILVHGSLAEAGIDCAPDPKSY